MRTRRTIHHGLAAVDVTLALLAVALLVAVAAPVLAGGKGEAGVQQSMANLVSQSVAHVIYAADWNGRQVQHNPEDLGVYGSIDDYNDAQGGCSGSYDPDCHPPIIAGWGQTEAGNWTIWAYWSTVGNHPLLHPLLLPGSPDSSAATDGWGHFRFPQARPIHEYLNGRYQDPVFYAPNDSSVVGPLEEAGCFGQPGEFVAYPSQCNPGWSSYCRSPAAIFHPDVMRSNAAGGWQEPWNLANGYETPGLFQAAYPGLKTHLIEHSWVQGPPAACNPAFFGCEPYYFNHGIDSSPVALFFDGSVRQLPNSEVLFADFEVLAQTGQVDGLWHRGTSFGANGYFIDIGFDGVPLSHHVLTTDGILGRDTIAETTPMPAEPPWTPARFGIRRAGVLEAAEAIPFSMEQQP